MGPSSVAVDCEGLCVQFGVTTELSLVILKGGSLLVPVSPCNGAKPVLGAKTVRK